MPVSSPVCSPMPEQRPGKQRPATLITIHVLLGLLQLSRLPFIVSWAFQTEKADVWRSRSEGAEERRPIRSHPPGRAHCSGQQSGPVTRPHFSRFPFLALRYCQSFLKCSWWTVLQMFWWSLFFIGLYCFFASLSLHVLSSSVGNFS